MDQAVRTPAPRQRTNSHSFSLRSDKSNEKHGPAPLSPTEKSEKARRDSFLRGESKANPNSALNEAQPGAVAAFEKTTIDSIRNIQHKDAYGNPIAEPDLSNPTRPRWERPLDTIRSFEKAIDGGYNRRSVSRAESTVEGGNNYTSRRSSYFGGYDSAASPGKQPQAGGGYYGGRRPDSYMESYGQNAGGPPGRRQYGQRGASDSAVQRLNGPGRGYHQHGFHESHDTVNTGVTNGSDSTGPWANSTDPSSENSSLDRVNAAMGKQQMDAYGYDNTILEDDASESYQNRMQRPNGYGPPPPAASSMNQAQAPRRTIQLGGGSEANGFQSSYTAQGGSLPTQARPAEEKRKSWLKRRFSKKE